MHPIILTLAGVNIYSYGVMLALSFGLVSFCVYRKALFFNIDPEKMIDMLFGILIFGLLGARMLHVLLDKTFYMENPLEIIKVYKGGLSVQGGMVAGLIFSVFFLKKNHLDFWVTGDLFAPFIALGQSIGRIGCFLNGCCYGSVTGSCMGVVFPGHDLPRHPTQLYASVLLMMIFVVLLILQNKRIFQKQLLLIYIMLYSVQRIAVDLFRTNISMTSFGISVGQGISIVFFIFAIGVLIWKNKKNISTN